jgi:hypothetical protein
MLEMLNQRNKPNVLLDLSIGTDSAEAVLHCGRLAKGFSGNYAPRSIRSINASGLNWPRSIDLDRGGALRMYWKVMCSRSEMCQRSQPGCAKHSGRFRRCLVR